MKKIINVIFLITISCQFVFAQKYKNYDNGYYYTKDSSKREGKILYEFREYKYFKFLSDPNSKPEKIDTDNCISFVVGNKKFVIKGGFQIKVGAWYIYEDRDFVEVITEGQLSLYKHYTIVGNSSGMYGVQTNPVYTGLQPGYTGVQNYILEKDNNIISAHPNKNKFAKQLSIFFSDYPELSNMIKTKKLRYEQVDEIVSRYNNWKAKT